MDTWPLIPYSIWCIFWVIFSKRSLTIKIIHCIKTKRAPVFMESPYAYQSIKIACKKSTIIDLSVPISW